MVFTAAAVKCTIIYNSASYIRPKICIGCFVPKWADWTAARKNIFSLYIVVFFFFNIRKNGKAISSYLSNRDIPLNLEIYIISL